MAKPLSGKLRLILPPCCQENTEFTPLVLPLKTKVGPLTFSFSFNRRHCRRFDHLGNLASDDHFNPFHPSRHPSVHTSADFRDAVYSTSDCQSPQNVTVHPSL